MSVPPRSQRSSSRWHRHSCLCLPAVYDLAKRPAVAAGGGVEVEALDELERLLGAEGAVHAGVLPLDRQRAVVAGVVEGAQDRLPVDAAAARRAVVPAAARV